jgi:hypothetical protein
MKNQINIIFLFFLFLFSGCITQFIPQTNESKELLIVEGLVTNKQGVSLIKLTKSMPLGQRSNSNPVKGCIVILRDDHDSKIIFSETSPGIYSAPSNFAGVIGRFYTMEIEANKASDNLSFKSIPVEMKPVPPIDSIYYNKVSVAEAGGGTIAQDGCQIYLNTHDDTDQCKFYRWEYAETWEIVIPYTVPNKVCWLSSNSTVINIKNTSVLAENKVNRYPLDFISAETDRLNVKYSMLVTQYSLNEDEFAYWEKLENLSEQVGGLYDMIPSSVPSNIYCVDDANVKVLGYFSVSASTSKRIIVKDNFRGVFNHYSADACIADTIFGGGELQGLNTSVWVLIDNFMPPYRVYTYSKGCYDCTLRGTNIKPEFWEDK